MEKRLYIEELIKNSDYQNLINYVDKLQESILHFDDPSLIMLAIEVYLNPNSIQNAEYQLEIVSFLIKCGLSLFAPKGDLILYILDKANDWGVSDMKIYNLLNSLVKLNVTNFITLKFPTELFNYSETYKCSYDYLIQNQAAIKIQRCYRNYSLKPQRSH